jgi:predicted ABC-type ATPase
MAMRTPLVVVLAGPNGAGKSTSAARLLPEALSVEEFVNADTIAQGLSAYRPEAAAVAAGRVMLERLHFLAHERRDFAFETTLAGRGHARWLRELRASRYRVLADLAGPRLIASRAAGMNAVIADPNAWENLKEKKR